MIQRCLVACLLLCLLAACASTEERTHRNDPLEPLNRKVYAFNDAVDRAVLKPVAQGYDAVTPEPVEDRVSDFFANLRSPIIFVNQLLQGKFKESAITTGRFLINTTVGLGGMFDVASLSDIPEYDEDFGQTLAVWGVKESPYIVLPILGPATIRDGIGRVPDSYLSPVDYAAREEDWFFPTALQVVDFRERLLDQQDLIDEAYDPYALVRDAYLQRRNFQISDGAADEELPDYDAFLDEVELDSES